MRKYVIYILACLTLTYCTSPNSQEQDADIIDASFYEKMELKLSEIIESVELIPLETSQECLMGGVVRVISTSDKYYVGDSYMGGIERIVVFDKKGDFLYKIDKKGQGAEEYTRIFDFYVSDDTDLKIVDSQRILTYNEKDQSLMSVCKVNAYLGKIIENEGDLFFFNKGHTTSYYDTRIREEAIVRIRDDKEEARFFIPAPEELPKMRSSGVMFPFGVYDKNVYFNYAYCDTIFQITDDRLSPRYIIDFGSKKIPKGTFQEEDGLKEMKKKIDRNEGVGNIWTFHKVKDFLYLGFVDYVKNGYILFYHPNTNKVLKGNVIVDDLFFVGSKFGLKIKDILPCSLDGDYLLWTLEADALLDRFYVHKESLSAAEWDAFRTKYPRLVSVCESLKVDDNPVLLKIKVKVS